MSIIEASSVTVKTMADNTLRLTVDIEPRFAKQAFALFGERGTAMALAALKVGAQPEPEPEPEKLKGGHLARQAGIWCDTPHFWGWLESIHHMPVVNSNQAADALREMLGIGSRAELDNNEAAAERFQTKVRAPFMKYMARFSCPEEVTA